MPELRSVAETGSTNDDLAALAAAGASEGLWLRADRQSGGKGRQGRAWQSPPGNLYASTLVRLRPDDPPAATLALVAAVALHEAVSLFFPPPSQGGAGGGSRPRGLDAREDASSSAHPRPSREGRVQIKWPNDLLVDGAKLAGILLERQGEAVVIGFGVNLAFHPDLADRPATSLKALAGRAPGPHAFLRRLAPVFGAWLGRWRAEGLGPVRAAWCGAAHPLGTPIATDETRGTFDGLDESGALKLRLPDGALRLIHAGDVFLI